MVNILERLFNELNKNKIKYCVLRKYQNLPEKPLGDVDLLIERESFGSALKIIKKLDFVFYPFTQPHYFFFGYDKKIGLVNLDVVLTNRLFEIERFKNFYIPAHGRDLRIRKLFLGKIKTNLQRKFYYLFKGKVISFIGPDGCGKTTFINSVYSILENYGVKKQKIYFGSRVDNKLYRVFDLSKKVLHVYLNKFLGRITFTDRYVYLTFRNNAFLNKVIRFLAPTPDKVYLLKVDVGEILRRKKELSKEKIEELYRFYSRIKGAIEIDNNKEVEENLEVVVRDVLNNRFLVD